jgi:hypothetical protein
MMTKARTIYRSRTTGRFVTEKNATAHHATTEKEHRPGPRTGAAGAVMAGRRTTRKRSADLWWDVPVLQHRTRSVPVETVATIQAPTPEAAARIADQQGQHVMWASRSNGTSQ